MGGTLPARGANGRASGAGGLAGGGRHARRGGRAGAGRGGRAGRVGRRAAALRGAGGGALAADLVHRAVVAGAVDVELATVALDDHERVAVAAVAGVVDEHAVARPADDLHVVVTVDLLGALA